MVVAVVNEEETVRIDLKTLAGGYVVLKRLSYGQKLYKKSLMKMTVQGGKGRDFAGELELVSEKAALFDFQHCVVEHNLEDRDGRKLDFSKIADVKKLDPRIGDEIGDAIDDLNNFEEDGDEGN